MKFRLIIGLLLVAGLAQAQYLDGVGTRWSDDFTEWNIYTFDEEDEELVGQLTMRWQMDMDWSSWDFRLGEWSGSIQRIFKNDPSQWEVRLGNEVVSMRTKWSNDFSEWRITDNSKTITFQSRYTNQFDYWLLKGDTYGSFYLHTEWEGDPREWVIVDELDEEISFAMKLAMLFIATYNSSPKYGAGN